MSKKAELEINGPTAVIGMQWGDEGKARVVDLLAENASHVVRYGGSLNTGHTVVRDIKTGVNLVESKKFVHHIVPAGIYNPDTLNVVTAGVFIDPDALINKEMPQFLEVGIDPRRNLRISDTSHLVMPWHVVRDKTRGLIRGLGEIGTTGFGVGPAVADRVDRVGLQMKDLIDPDRLADRLRRELDAQNLLMVAIGHELFSFTELYNKYVRLGERLAPYVSEVEPVVRKAVREQENILFEGAQAQHLDVDLGQYPYSTSTNPGVVGIQKGLGVGRKEIREVYGVKKPYNTRVGNGPMPTELLGEDGYINEIGKLIVQNGGEYGASTGRMRRPGWDDWYAVKSGIRANEVTTLGVPKLDVLDCLSEILVCEGYRKNGRILSDDEYPTGDAEKFVGIEPIYRRYNGWMQPTTGIRSYKHLPKNARILIEDMEDYLGVPVRFIGVGAHHDANIIKPPR